MYIMVLFSSFGSDLIERLNQTVASWSSSNGRHIKRTPFALFVGYYSSAAEIGLKSLL